ncbi:MAG: P-II family nitrogen regulator [Elusimicrobiota bacterium]
MAEFDLITCIVQRGVADKVTNVAMKFGAQGTTTFFARGTGVRQKLGLLGALIQPEKEVLFIATKREQTDQIFDEIVKTAKLDKPGEGLIYSQPIDRVVGLL